MGAEETIGRTPDGLSKVVNVVAPGLKKEIVLSVETEEIGHPRDSVEEKWPLEGGIEVPCIFMVPKIAKPNLEIN